MTQSPPHLEICVCTYRRPQVVQTLRSLQNLVLPDGYNVTVLVIDNDAAPSAQEAVQKIAEMAAIPVRYAHVPQGNISIARNGALAHSHADFLAFIDDDEVAAEDWLFHLTQKMEEDTADVVLGPVEAVYAPNAPAWMRAQQVHSTAPVWTHGEITTGYTCNVLIKCKTARIRGLSFDLSLGKSGGEDTKFFHDIFERGGKITFAPKALVYEDVPDDRARLGWLVRRRFRMGQTHGKILAAKSALLARVAQFGLALAKVVFCAGVLFATSLIPPKRNAALLRLVLHIGTMAGLVGLKPVQIYGASTAHIPEKSFEVMDLK